MQLFSVSKELKSGNCADAVLLSSGLRVKIIREEEAKCAPVSSRTISLSVSTFRNDTWGYMTLNDAYTGAIALPVAMTIN